MSRFYLVDYAHERGAEILERIKVGYGLILGRAGTGVFRAWIRPVSFVNLQGSAQRISIECR